MPTDREKEKLRGPVESVRTETAEYSRHDSGLVEGPWLVEIETFNEEGYLLESIFHNTQHPEYSSKQVLTYDTNGRPIQVSSYLNGMRAGKSVYLYDSADRLVEMSSYSAEEQHTGKRTFNYHPNGKKAEELFFDYLEHKPNTGYSYDVDANADYDHLFNANGARVIKTLFDLGGNPRELHFLAEKGELLNKVVFTTDDAGRIVKDAQYAGKELPFEIPEGTEIPPEIAQLFNRDTPLFHSELVYDEEGRKTEDRTYFGDSLITRRTLTYNIDGEPIEEAIYEASGNLQSKTRQEYEYDHMGNWIRKLVLSWSKEKVNFEPSVVYGRTIKYYE